MQRYFGTAIGKGRQAAKTEVERLKLGEISCEQGVTEVAKMCALSSLPHCLEAALRCQAHIRCKVAGCASYPQMSECFERLLTTCMLPHSLHSVHDEEKPFELEVSWICDATDRVFQRVPEDVLRAAEVAAKAALEESDMYADPVSSQCCQRTHAVFCVLRLHMRESMVACSSFAAS